MAVSQVVKVCVAFAGAVLLQAGAPSPVFANWAVPACDTVLAASGGRPATQAVTRSGQIPGLGRVAGSIDWDNRQQLALSGPGFQVTRTYTPLTREVEIVISGTGEDTFVVRLGGVEGFSVARGAQVVRGTADLDAIRALVTGRAVSAFRERVGNYERYLIAGNSPTRADDAHADGFLLAGAFLGSLAGDPTALGRTRDLIMRRVRGRLLAVRVEFTDCVRDYEKYLLKIDEQRTVCLEAANGRDTWYARAADRLGCELEFMAGALAGEGQFISCTALGAIVG
ncbi:hypothetical protein BH24ACI5_BH24ACI5_01670 [soil metagenome]